MKVVRGKGLAYRGEENEKDARHDVRREVRQMHRWLKRIERLISRSGLTGWMFSPDNLEVRTYRFPARLGEALEVYARLSP